jgi:nucleoid-associated protein YgaU
MTLREKYNVAIQAAKGHMEGAAEEREGKLHFRGTVKTEAEANRIWDAIKTVPEWRNEVMADIKVVAPPTAKVEPMTYTVKAGDTLSKIAKDLLGDPTGYMKIFEMNKDQLTDPDKIKPGQVLKIPGMPVHK